MDYLIEYKDSKGLKTVSLHFSNHSTALDKINELKIKKCSDVVLKISYHKYEKNKSITI